MKINFKGHTSTEREVELTQEDLAQLFNVMRKEFIEYITYARFGSYSPNIVELNITSFCDKFGVDGEYDKDRIAFFTELLSKLENPYK